MTDFTREKFLGLDPSRQVKVSLDLIYQIEDAWNAGGQQNLSKLISYMQWIANTEHSEVLRMPPLLMSLEKDISLRKILNVAIAFERYLNLSLKDHEIVVTKEDRLVGKEPTDPIYIVLDNLRSGFNVGSIFRAAECLGVHHIFLVGYTPNPEDAPVQKTAMGTEAWVPWSTVDSIFDLISEFRKKGISMAAMETSGSAVSLYEAVTSPELALFFGNERFGLQPDVLEQMDLCLEIPMRGRKNSLNISNALAIGVSEIQRSWREKAE